MCQMAETRKVFLVGVGPGGREEAVALVASDLAIEVVWELHPRPPVPSPWAAKAQWDQAGSRQWHP